MNYRITIFTVLVPSILYGVSRKSMVYYDPSNHANLCSELSESIAQMETELKKGRHYPKSKLKYFSWYFRLTKHETDSGFDYEADIEKIEYQLKNKVFSSVY